VAARQLRVTIDLARRRDAERDDQAQRRGQPRLARPADVPLAPAPAGTDDGPRRGIGRAMPADRRDTKPKKKKKKKKRRGPIKQLLIGAGVSAGFYYGIERSMSAVPAAVGGFTGESTGEWGEVLRFVAGEMQQLRNELTAMVQTALKQKEAIEDRALLGAESFDFEAEFEQAQVRQRVLAGRRSADTAMARAKADRIVGTGAGVVREAIDALTGGDDDLSEEDAREAILEGRTGVDRIMHDASLRIQRQITGLFGGG
jgi:hypothetical protein